MNLKNIFGSGLLLFCLILIACEKNDTPEPDPTDPPMTMDTVNHAPWDQLLQQYVNAAGDVNYGGLKSEQAKINTYLDHLKTHPPKTEWSDNKKMAYWINLYNAYTIKSIVDAYPLNSILDLDNGHIWTTRMVPVGTTSYTLDQIEKDKLLAVFNEPRVHFAVNCAAASCPPLLNKAWTAYNIQQYYDQVTRAFINNTTYNTLGANALEVSKIFDWYASDFGGANNVATYIQNYTTTTIAPNATVTFKNYNWALNEQ